MDISRSNEPPSSPPTHHTASAPLTRQPEELPSYAQSTTSFEQALEQILDQNQAIEQALDQNQALINIAPIEQAVDIALDQNQTLINIAQSLISTTNDVFSDLASSSAGGKRSMPAHPPEPPKKRNPWPDDKDVLIIYSKHKESKPSAAIVIKLQAIPKATANAACESLDKEVDRKKEEGALEAGKSSSVKLEWTVQTQEVVRIYEDSPDLAPIQSLGGNPKGKTKWACPIVYGDVLPEKPLRYPSSALGYGIIGIIALGNLNLPEIADSGPNQIPSGSVAYFRDSSPVIFRGSNGRGIMFYIRRD